MKRKFNKIAVAISIALMLLLCSCTNVYQDEIENLKVGDMWTDSLCQWTIMIESNEKWDKYKYNLSFNSGSIYYTISKKGKVLSLWRK